MPFKGRAEVQKSRVWRNPEGRQASIYGCKPYGEGWEIVSNGWDIYWHGDGTFGRCQVPFKAKAEADAFAEKWNNR